jgi:hypothetical protein
LLRLGFELLIMTDEVVALDEHDQQSDLPSSTPAAE